MQTLKKLLTYSVFLHLVVILLAVEVYILALQNKELKRELSAAGSQPELLKEGDIVPSFWATTIDGRPEEISYNEPRKLHLLLVFNTTCPACKENLPNWIEISRKLDSKSCALIGISLHKPKTTQKYVLEKGVPFTVLVPRDSMFIKNYKSNAIPQTVLIESGGKVRKVWNGVLSSENKKEIANFVY